MSLGASPEPSSILLNSFNLPKIFFDSDCCPSEAHGLISAMDPASLGLAVVPLAMKVGTTAFKIKDFLKVLDVRIIVSVLYILTSC